MAGTVAEPYVLRLAGEADIGRLVDMRLRLQDHLNASNAEAWRMSTAQKQGLAKTYRNFLENPEKRVLVACDQTGNVVGMAMGTICRHTEFEPETSGKLDDVWVSPDHRNKGLCTRMVGELLSFFREAGVESLVLDYIQGNTEAEAVWTRLGFCPVVITAVGRLDKTERRLGVP